MIADEAGDWKPRGDPTEAALITAARKGGVERKALATQLPEVGEIPFSSERMFMATFHRDVRAKNVAIYVKGAPDRVVSKCVKVHRSSGAVALDDTTRARILEKNTEFAAQGLRVLALAYSQAHDVAAQDVDDLTFVALIGMIDPPADGVVETIDTLRGAGIRIVMITGDQQQTALAVGSALHIVESTDAAAEGRDVEALDSHALKKLVQHTNIFSRINPETKLRIVAALQENGEVVGMLGDGVNDAAALKQSDIGVAMGKRGSDVAKEAAGVILEDDRFSTIAVAIEEGRVIFANIQKFVFYLISCNLGEVMLLLVAAVGGLPLPLLPLQILWLNLVTDTFPALALAVDGTEAAVMQQRPRDPGTVIFSRALMLRTFAYGALIAAVGLAAFLWSLQRDGADTHRAATLCFMTLSFAQLMHLSNAGGEAGGIRRVLRNRFALAAIAVTIVLQICAVVITPLRDILQLTLLETDEWLIIIALGFIPLLVGRLIGLFARPTPKIAPLRTITSEVNRLT